MLLALSVACLSIALGSQYVSQPTFADAAGCGLGTWDGVECVISGNVNATGTYDFHHSVRLDSTAHVNASSAGITLNIDGAAGLNLVMQSGSIIEADDIVPTPNNPAGPITIHATGTMVMTDATVDTRNTTQGGAGGDILIDVDGDLTIGGTSQIISTNLGNGDAGDIKIQVGNYPNTPGTGTFDLGADAEVEANSNGAGGDIIIEVGRTTDIHGDILSQVLTGNTGTGATQGRDGASIFIKSGCDLTQYSSSTISSRGRAAGADLVHLEACDVTISGLVESAGSGLATPNSPPNHCADADRPGKPNNSTGCIEVWAGNLTITNTGELNADINEPGTGGATGQSWIDLMASHNITVTGHTGGTDAFAVHADSNSGSDATINYVTVKANNMITATGRAFSADLPAAGSDGGQIIVEAGADVSLVAAHLLASGDDVQMGGFGQGGTISVRSFQGSITWTSGIGDVRPTGADTVAPVDVSAPSAASGKRGVINLTFCVAMSTTGSSFPFNGDTATTPAPVNDCSQNEPTMQSYVECCVSTEACDPLEAPTPTPTVTPSASPTPTASAIPSGTATVAPTTAPTATPPATATISPALRAVVQVPGSQPWFDTGIDVPADAGLQFDATGIVHVAGSDSEGKSPVGAFGCLAPANGTFGPFLAPGLTCWSLVGKVGSSAPFQVGAAEQHVNPTLGRLFLSLDDDVFGDNSGSFTVTVSIWPTGAMPAGTTTQLTSGANPADSGSLLTYAASVSAPLGVPIGTVIFVDGAHVLGEVPLDANGVASVTTTALLGGHNVLATYRGNDTYEPSKDSLFQTVTLPGDAWAPTSLGVGLYALVGAPSDSEQLVAAGGSNFYSSVDGGATWSVSGLPAAGGEGDLAIDPTDPEHILAAIFGSGIWQSFDRGATWTATTGVSGSTGLLDVKFSPTVHGLALAASYGNCGAVFRSTDGGSSWTNSFAGFGCYDQYTVAFDPTLPDVVYVGSYFGGGRVFRSIDMGLSWVSLPGTPPSSAGAVRGIIVDPADAAHLFIGTEYSGIFESTNGGTVWTQLAAGPSGCVCEVLAPDPLDADILYARQLGGGVEFTIDGGTTWTTTGGGLGDNATALVVLADRVYAATSSAGVYLLDR